MYRPGMGSPGSFFCFVRGRRLGWTTGATVRFVGEFGYAFGVETMRASSVQL